MTHQKAEKPLSIKTINIYNTLTRKVEPFKPISNNEVKIYCCGPTVYLFQHIGNFRTYIFEDVLVRTLRFAGYKVNHVMNITDVGHLVGDADDGEDKMLMAARREKKKSFEIAEFYTDRFFDDARKLNIKKPDVVCKATDHIQEMIDLTKKIEENGYAYFANGNVYFDVMKDKNYGKLAGLNLEKLQAGATIEVDEHKRSPFDFVLWFTKSKFENQELQWDSPWGTGYPGWHIECSAMSMKYLGDQFDIHCGGYDHITVHHTNEIAQSEAATQKPWVNYWLHAQFLTVDGEKMGKSKGNLYLIKDFEDRKIDPMAFRFLTLSSHYRSHLNFTWDTVTNAENSYQKLKKTVLNLKKEVGESISNINNKDLIKSLTPSQNSLLAEFESAIFDDLNTANAITTIWKVVNDSTLNSAEKLGLVFIFDEVLGFSARDWKVGVLELSDEVKSLVAQRDQARANKDFKESDRIRDLLKSQGFEVLDSVSGTILK